MKVKYDIYVSRRKDEDLEYYGSFTRLRKAVSRVKWLRKQTNLGGRTLRYVEVQLYVAELREV